MKYMNSYTAAMKEIDYLDSFLLKTYIYARFNNDAKFVPL